MTDKPDQTPKQNPAQAARAARLNAALRANLKRRKAADSVQVDTPDDADAGDQPPSEA